MLSNWIIFWGSPDVMANPVPYWASTASIRYAASEVLIVLGMAGCLGGYISMFMVVKSTSTKTAQGFALFGSIGIVGTAMAHGNFGCIEPLIYKVLIQNGIPNDVYLQIDEMISSHFGLADVLIVLASISQAIIAIYLILSKKITQKKSMLLCNMIATFAIAFLINTVIGNSFSGTLLSGSKNLGDALMYLIPYTYWKNQ